MGTFEIFIGRDGQYYWRLKASNGEVICSSEGYTAKHNAQNGIAACKRYSQTAPTVDLT